MLIPTAKSDSVAQVNVVEQHLKRAQYNVSLHNLASVGSTFLSFVRGFV